jgi:hypothetical protein
MYSGSDAYLLELLLRANRSNASEGRDRSLQPQSNAALHVATPVGRPTIVRLE